VRAKQGLEESIIQYFVENYYFYTISYTVVISSFSSVKILLKLFLSVGHRETKLTTTLASGTMLLHI